MLTGIDPWYVKAQKLGRLYVPYDETAILWKSGWGGIWRYSRVLSPGP